MTLVLLFVCLLTLRLSNTVPLYPYKADILLNNHNHISVNWRNDNIMKRVHFALECFLEPNYSWLAFGFSDHGEYEGSDVCIWDRRNFQHATINNFGSIRPDQKNYCHFDHIDRYPDGRFTIYFWRPYDTCDQKGYLIEDGTTQLTVLVGTTQRRNTHGEHVLKSIQAVRLLQNMNQPTFQVNIEILEAISRNVTIPDKETTYWCTVIKLPDMHEKRHIVKYEATIQKGNEEFVHHMETFHCEQPPSTARWRFPMYSGECHSPTMPSLVKSCRRVIGAWAMGAPPLVYPVEAGAPIGGRGYFPFIMLEVHYNNPMRKSGVIDNSGMRFYYTSNLRKYDAGVVEVGLEYTDRMAIPPGQSSFSLTGYCTPECTDALLPNRGITIFASQLHSHLTGRQLATWHIREGAELGIVNKDRHYSPHWQEIRPVEPMRILPGDALLTTCVYDTSKRKNITLGGYGITDEMCVNYIHYYPKSQLEVCKSAVDVSALEIFFERILKYQKRNFQTNRTVSRNYKSIRWDKKSVRQLKEFYNNAPIRAECRRNDGRLIDLNPRKPIEIVETLPLETSPCENDTF